MNLSPHPAQYIQQFLLDSLDVIETIEDLKGREFPVLFIIVNHELAHDHPHGKPQPAHLTKETFFQFFFAGAVQVFFQVPCGVDASSGPVKGL